MRRSLGFVHFSSWALMSMLWGCSDDGSTGSQVAGGTGGSAASSSGGGSAARGSAAGGSGGTIVVDGGGGSGAGGGGGGGNTLPTPVEVLITSDNAYGFGYGDGNRMLNYFGGIENPDATDIFDCPVGHGPEAYTVPADSANAGNYLYIVGYADKSTTQGVIAKFSRAGAGPVFTGNGAWQACATGQDFDVGSGGPSRNIIDQQIGICNARTGDPSTTSAGWVGTTANANGMVAFGEDNTTDRDAVMPGNEFEIVCEIDAQARWMWFDWDPNADQSPFIWPGGSANVDKEFILFRLGAEFVPEPPS